MATLEITTRIGCKNMCSYCPQKMLISSYEKNSDEYVMSFETFKKCLSKVPRSVRIDFSGMSEPWLNKNCTQMVLEAKKMGFKFVIYTTCVDMTVSDYNKIRDLDIEKFVIHLPDAEGKTEIVVDKQYLSVMEEFCKNPPKGCVFLYFNTIHKDVQKILKKYSTPTKDVNSWLISRAGNLSKKLKKSRKYKKYKKTICTTSKNKLDHNVLLPNGDVVLCCMDYGLKHKLGNLLNQRYSDLFRGKEFLRIKQSLNNKCENIICKNCEASVKKWTFEYIVYIFSSSRIYTLGIKTNKKLMSFLRV